VKQLPTLPDLQQALSGVPPRLWTARMDRRVHRARQAGQSGIDIAEFSAAGVLVWRADLAGAGTASLAGWGAAKPTRNRWTLRLRRWTGATVLAPHVGVGTLGEHHWGEITAVALCGFAGLLGGGWAVGGPVSVGWGAVAGAAVGWAAWWVFLLVARRRIIGRPVDVTDPEVMALVVQLAETGRRAADLHLPETEVDIGWTARQITYQVVDPHLTDDQFIQLRYRARMLDHAVGQALRAQANLDAATAIADDRAGGSPAIAPGSDHLAATADRLTAHAAAMNEIAGHIRTIRRSWPAAG